MTSAACPACGSAATEVFSTLRQLPVHGQSVFARREDALDLLRADQVLTVCRDCAFVFNRTFDASLLDYSGRHEESQAFSPTFRAFAEGLARGWVQRYDLAGELVVEVGCGKGDFLRALVAAGVGRAHGIDPGLEPERLTGIDAITTEVARFAASATTRAARAVVCRHTLEHVPDVAGFLADVRDGADPQTCRALLFEVPDLGRVLAQGAFWDLQYEHCSSFTATSLHGLFTRAGLHVRDLRRVYDDQYLVVEAALDGPDAPAPDHLAPAHLAPAHLAPDHLAPDHLAPDHLAPDHLASVQDVVDACRGFGRAVDAQLDRWSAWFAERAAAAEEVVVWGGGAKGQVFLNALPGSGVRRVVDINAGLQGGWMGGVGLPIVAPQALVAEPPDEVLLMNGIYLAEVRRTLDDLGLPRVGLRSVDPVEP